MHNWQNNINSAVANRAYYDKVWPLLGSTEELDYTERYRVEFIVDSIVTMIGTVDDLKILDFGCGRGWMSPFLSAFGKVTGVDFSPVGIQYAKDKYGEHGTFRLADAADPYLGLSLIGEFDVIVCSEVIEHVGDHKAFLQQLSGLLRPGGWCVLTTPNGNVWDEFRRVPAFMPDLQPIENWLTPKHLIKLFQDVGFCIKRHEGRPVFSFRRGVTAPLQNARVQSMFARFGLSMFYHRLILPDALYQMIMAQKRDVAFAECADERWSQVSAPVPVERKQSLDEA